MFRLFSSAMCRKSELLLTRAGKNLFSSKPSKEIVEALMKEKIVFKEIKNRARVSYEGEAQGRVVRVDIGEFPDEPLYNLHLGDEVHEVSRPKNWTFK